MISQNFLAMADKTEKVFRTRKFVLRLNFLEIVQPFKEWLILSILLQQFYFYCFNKLSLRISLNILRVKVQWMGFANSINPKTFICHNDHRIFIQQSIPIICTLPQINSFWNLVLNNNYKLIAVGFPFLLNTKKIFLRYPRY